ncbi:MAG: hypothetical protein ACI3U8_09475 [Candidatus Onthomonas sp.]
MHLRLSFIDSLNPAERRILGGGSESAREEKRRIPENDQVSLRLERKTRLEPATLLRQSGALPESGNLLIAKIRLSAGFWVEAASSRAKKKEGYLKTIRYP